jgi:hypothetical protein
MADRLSASLASSSICTFPVSAPDTGQPSLAPSAALVKAAASTPGTWPRTSSFIRVILKPSPAFSTVHLAVVAIRVAGVPAASSPAARAMLMQAACAAAISSSGLVPFSPSNRVPKEYFP